MVVRIVRNVWEQERARTTALESDRAKLFRVLWVNVVADAGYVGLGIALARRRDRHPGGVPAAARRVLRVAYATARGDL